MAANPKFNPHPLAPTAESMDQAPIGPPVVAQPLRGKSVPKKGSGKTSVSSWPTNSPRNIQERMGSRCRIEVNLPGPKSPEAAHTQANGRIMPAVMGQKQNFYGGMETHN